MNRRPTTCPNCGSDDIHSHSLTWWCGRCRMGRNYAPDRPMGHEDGVPPRRPWVKLKRDRWGWPEGSVLPVVRLDYDGDPFITPAPDSGFNSEDHGFLITGEWEPATRPPPTLVTFNNVPVMVVSGPVGDQPDLVTVTPQEYATIAQGLREGSLIPKPSCATCVHWDKYPTLDFGRCGGITDESTEAWFDRSGYVVTLPTFGCIEHRAHPLTDGEET